MPADPPADRTRKVKEPALMSTPHRGRPLAVAVVGVAFVVPAAVGAEAGRDVPVLDVPPGVVDEAASFSVVNRNTAALACPSDGGLTDEATARFQAALGSCMSGGTPSRKSSSTARASRERL
jgi:hypothetical protein